MFGRASRLCTDPTLMILPLPRVTIPLGERRTSLDAGVVHADVGRPPGLLDPAHARVHRRGVGDVEGLDQHLTTGRLPQPGGRRLGRLAVATVDDDPGPGLQQTQSQGVADASTRTRDQRRTTGQIEQVHRLLPSLAAPARPVRPRDTAMMPARTTSAMKAAV